MKGIWKVLDGETGNREWCDYIIILKYKIKNR